MGDMASARQGYKTRKSGRVWFYGNQVCLAPKQYFMEGKGELAPRLLKGINTTPRAPKDGWLIHPFIHQRVADTKEKHREEADGRRKSSSCLGDGLGHALAATVSPAWWSHGGVPEPMPWFHQGNCTFYIRRWNKSCFFFTLIYIDECFIHMCS
jgi:hypothetical protein